MADTTATTEPGLPKSSGDDGSKVLHKNKKQRRNTIVVSPDHGNYNYTIDKDDYDTVCEILSTYGEEAKRQVYNATDTDSTDGRVVELELDSLEIASLSPVVRKLEKLEILSLDHLDRIDSLPHEIKDLACLKVLSLSYCRSLGRLPDWIGDLSNLKVLDLQHSGITSLPDSMSNMKSLRCLVLDGTDMVEDSPNDPSPILWKLIKNCKFLGAVGFWRAYYKNKKLQFALACNRFRSRTGLNAKKVNTIAPSLWPHALQTATRPFRHYSEVEVMGFHLLPYTVKQIDSIHQLIKDRRDSFIGTLINRNADN